jgi:peptidoglycan hydrolase CwlO-like protein
VSDEPIIPAPDSSAPVPAAPSGKDTVLQVNARTLWFAAMFLGGGAVTGGGVSFANSSTEQAAVEDAVKPVTEKLDKMQIQLTKIESGFDSAKEHRDRMQKELDAHDERIRALEAGD